MHQCWGAVSAQDLFPSDFSDQRVLFHRPSGKTHFLNNTACTLLDLVSEQPLDEATLARVLAERHPELKALESRGPDGTGSELHEHVRGILFRFEELGLVSQAPA